MDLFRNLWRETQRCWSTLVADVAGLSPYRAWLCVSIGLALLVSTMHGFRIGGSGSNSGDLSVAPTFHAEIFAVGLAQVAVALLVLAVSGQALLRWRRGSSTKRNVANPLPGDGSRGFWLYCAFLSLLVVAMGVGSAMRGTILQGGRTGPVTSAQGDPGTGVLLIVVGLTIVGLCLVNAFRSPRA